VFITGHVCITIFAENQMYAMIDMHNAKGT